MMQFGHNDGGALDGALGGRVSLPGVGEETKEFQGATVHTFGWYLRKYIADTRAKGATPMVCTLVPRKIWDAGKIHRDSENYAGWATAVAKAENVALIDLNEIIARQYDQLGPERVEPLFADEHTHTSRAGSELNAASVVKGLKGLARDPLAAYLRP
jgi:lysophospholipase L1-like esterase